MQFIPKSKLQMAAVAALAVGGSALAFAGVSLSEGSAVGPPPSVAAHTGHVVLTSSVSNALADVGNDISYVHAVVTHGSTVVADSSTWVAPNGSSRVESFDAAGEPLVDETISNTGSAQVIDYTRQAWWTLSSSEKLAAVDVQGMIGDLQSGALKAGGDVTVNGRTELELTGSPPELPTGSTVTLLVDPSTDLPISATDVEPGATIQEQLSWIPVTSQNKAQLSAVVPAGFVHLSSPPTGIESAGLG